MSNVKYSFSIDGKIAYGELSDGTVFMFDSIYYDKIKHIKWYRGSKVLEDRKTYISDCRGKKLHRYLMGSTPGYEIDHINLDTFDNRLSNLRVCTHQQNQCNQPLQINNSSGVTGVSYYEPRSKFRARIKVCQHDIHLGYYNTLIEATQARNVGMECMFGEYGYYNDVESIPDWIRKKVNNICKRFVDLSICEAFVLSVHKAG